MFKAVIKIIFTAGLLFVSETPEILYRQSVVNGVKEERSINTILHRQEKINTMNCEFTYICMHTHVFAMHFIFVHTLFAQMCIKNDYLNFTL